MKGDKKSGRLEVTLFSFGFKHGLPEDVNILWDVRFLPNPYWEEPLRHLTGKDERIRDYVLKSRAGEEFMDALLPLLSFTLRECRDEGKQSLRIGIGCTGGHHRSVSVVEHLSSLIEVENIQLHLEHRDIEKD